MDGMERPLFKAVGTPVLQLDTPALVVDLSVLERNIATVHAFFRQCEARLRPHVSVHRCPAIAHKQLAAGDTVEGISVTTLGEAEVFAAYGFSDIFVANEVVTPLKIARLCALARQARVTVGTDNPRNVQQLSEAATTHGVTLRVVVDVQTSPDRCGVMPGKSVLDLARLVSQAPHLDFVGLMTVAEPILTEDRAALAVESRQALQPIVDMRNMLQAAGIAVPVVSVGGTSNYEIAGNTVGITEIRAGTYTLIDARYSRFCPQLQTAARVLSTVTSRPEASTAITDTGQKAIGVDLGLPIVTELPGAIAARLSAEHCCLQLDGAAQGQMALGDKLWLTPWDIGTCVNLYDTIHAVRQNALEVVWPIPARGQYR
jgi:D-serine deaminase-like pyridoxal phosphate-dependent protein